jgi:hypothetical protein
MNWEQPGNVKSSHYAFHEGIWEVEVQLHSFVTSALHRALRTAPRPGGINQVERAPVTH